MPPTNDAGIDNRWKCPACSWWNQWTANKCAGCGAADKLHRLKRELAAAATGGAGGDPAATAGKEGAE